MQKNLLIVEDDATFLLGIEQMLEELGKYNVIGTSANATSAIQILSKTHPDLIIMDIGLPEGMNGIELAQSSFCENIPILFITNHSDEQTYLATIPIPNHALLIKPFHKFTLASTIELLLQNKSTFASPHSDLLYFRSGSKREGISIDTIVYIESERNYCTIVTKEKSYTIKKSLTKMKELLPMANFTPIHKSYIVKLSCIRLINFQTQTVSVELSDNSKVILPLGRSYIKLLRTLTKQLG